VAVSAAVVNLDLPTEAYLFCQLTILIWTACKVQQFW